MRNLKLEYDFVKKRIEKRGFILLEDTYVNNATNMKIKTKEGYLIFCSYGNLINGKKNPTIFGFNNPYWKDNVIKYISTMEGNSKILSIKKITKSNRNRILVDGICECGEKFSWVFCNDKAKTDKFMCQKCKKRITASKRRLRLSEVKKIFKDYGYKVLSDKENFNKMLDKILVEDNEGYRGYMTISHVTRGQHFSIFSNALNKDFVIYNANTYLKNNGYLTRVIDIDSSKYYRGGFKCICGCGKIFYSPIYSLVGGDKIQCESCSGSISSYERKVRNFLEEQKIEYIAEYSIYNCKDILPLPFDFYIKGKLIEIDGEGHFKPCNFNQISNEDALKTFDITKKHDEIKNDYCKKNNIPLLRIPYTNFKKNEYKEKILSFIRE